MCALVQSEQQVGDQGGQDLNAYSIFAAPHKALDVQVLLDPFEEQLNLPALFVDRRNGGGAEAKMIGEKDQGLLFFSSHTSTRRSG